MTKSLDKYWANRLAEIKTTFRSLRYRNYRLFFYGQSISLIGTWIQRITTPWLVYELTGSAFMLGVVSFADQIPSLLLSPLAGVLTDRWNRYQLLIITQIGAMIQALLLAFLFLSGTIEVWHIILLSIFHGCVKAFDVTARQSFLIEMVEKKRRPAQCHCLEFNDDEWSKINGSLHCRVINRPHGGRYLLSDQWVKLHFCCSITFADEDQLQKNKQSK